MTTLKLLDLDPQSCVYYMRLDGAGVDCSAVREVLLNFCDTVLLVSSSALEFSVSYNVIASFALELLRVLQDLVVEHSNFTSGDSASELLMLQAYETYILSAVGQLN